MKNNLRIIAKRKRKLISLNSEDKNTFLKNINSCLDRVFSIENTIKEVGLYYPIFNEISPLVFIKYFKDNNITTALPVVDINSNSMVFKKWFKKEKLQKSNIGTYEPLLTNKTIFPQIVVVPMLTFDRKLNRLGYGAGYYDKLISTLKRYFDKKQKNFITIGLAYSEQETKSIPYESHDQKLDFIVTEKEILSKVN
ncbi:5-formyltetrahydrofolate cyclo-ligase [Candidatus Levibacter sp. Uisw_134_01]|uniref:5-formyltetrahydrofolate cyclo-ligase n=1 Tax=Candidatus Levibacter sp. Uisw_134_01 TaxID=3230999 RepID=UPI003D46A3F9